VKSSDSLALPENIPFPFNTQPFQATLLPPVCRLPWGQYGSESSNPTNRVIRAESTQPVVSGICLPTEPPNDDFQTKANFWAAFGPTLKTDLFDKKLVAFIGGNKLLIQTPNPIPRWRWPRYPVDNKLVACISATRHFVPAQTQFRRPWRIGRP
jgi:hypothetical protein